MRSVTRENGLSPYSCVFATPPYYPNFLFPDVSGGEEIQKEALDDFHRKINDILDPSRAMRRPKAVPIQVPLNLKEGDYALLRRPTKENAFSPKYSKPVCIKKVTGRSAIIESKDGKVDTVDLSRLKKIRLRPPPLPEPTPLQNSAEIIPAKTTTRSGRRVRFRQEEEFTYF